MKKEKTGEMGVYFLPLILQMCSIFYSLDQNLTQLGHITKV